MSSSLVPAPGSTFWRHLESDVVADALLRLDRGVAVWLSSETSRKKGTRTEEDFYLVVCPVCYSCQFLFRLYHKQSS